MDGNKRNLNCFYSILAKKRNSHGHFKYIKNHKIIPRNCCFGVITLCSPKNVLFISMIFNLNCFYSIFAKKRNSHGHFKCIKNHKTITRNCCFSVITLCSPKNFQHLILTLHRQIIDSDSKS